MSELRELAPGEHEDKFEVAINTLQSMLLDYKMGGIDRKTVVGNLKSFAKRMEKDFINPKKDNN